MGFKLAAQNKTLIGVLVLAVLAGVLLGYSYLEFKGSEIEGIVTKLSELKSIIEENRVVAVLFTSTTCPTCKAVEPEWKKLAREGRGGVVYVEVRFDPTLSKSELQDLIEIFNYYKVERVPTLLVFKGGSLSLVKEGVPADKNEIYNIISKVLRQP